MNIKKFSFEQVLVYGSLLIPFGLLFKVISIEAWGICLFLSSLAFFLERGKIFFPRLFINLAGILFIALFFLTVNLSNFLENALRTLLFLLSLKLLEKKALRDFFQIYLLEFLILAGASYFYTHFTFFILLILQIFYVGYALFFHLYMVEMEVKTISWRELRGGVIWFGVLLWASLFLSGVFFIGLPRLKTPLFNLAKNPEEKAKTGFTNQIRLGVFSEIQESARKVLRLSFEEGKVLNPDSLYFRVMVYDYFDGRSWQRKYIPEEIPGKGDITGRAFKGTIYLEEDLEGYLPVPDGTMVVRKLEGVRTFADGVFKLDTPLIYPLRYEILLLKETNSYAEDLPLQSSGNLAPYLQVPHVDERVLSLAKRLKGKDAEETIKKTLGYFQQEGFRYSLTKLPLTQKPLETFLFETKRGNCEYFAGATALLFRLNGIPSRVIGGYKGAIYHERGGYYLVEERFAHSWVEAWLNGRWLRVDPSPSASFVLLSQNQGLLYKIKLYLDWINFYYTKIILDFDFSKQKRLLNLFKSDLLKRTQKDGKEFSFSGLKGWLKVALIVFGVVIFLAVLFKHKKELPFFWSSEKRLLYLFLKELKKMGYPKLESEGLFELAEKIKNATLREEVLRFISLYSEYSYKDRPFDKEVLKRLRECLKRLQSLR
ncbi:transglutaminase [Caldimicrobium thiodismutans]|uniref:Transglutaminase n=1 Tax=Caldimicrobium thiodismutans TaxID=1653476 RepID=A0A0U5B177_9BACT|nr:DUF3488 and transglutaminase-like domain-containing protein [Caldimicrobium thiodismutans]BAU23817.1 transglutaminase [Caldimicrobium thiodismutans]